MKAQSAKVKNQNHSSKVKTYNNILFLGSSDYCQPVLKTLYQHFNLVAVVTQPDKPVGRKNVLTPSLPKKFALSHNVDVFTPRDKRELLDLKTQIKRLSPDIGIVADYGLIIPKEIYKTPRLKTLNIHFSKLPKFRGPSPVQYTILYGEKSAWISILFIDEEIDTGDILWQKEVPLSSHDTTETLYKKLFNITSSELPSVLSLYAENELKPQKQDHSKATDTKLLKREDGYIPSKLLELATKGEKPSDEQIKKWPFVKILDTKYLILNTSNIIERAVRAFIPWPGVWTEIEINQLSNYPIIPASPSQGGQSTKKIKKRLKILKAHLDLTTHNLQPTTKLVIDKVQLEGKKPVSLKQFKQGYPNFRFS